MSYDGTVRCGWCHARGHNKRSCPHRKKYVKELRDAGKSNWATREDNMYKKTTRKCSYCFEEGHNVRTCPKIKEDMDWISRADQAWRRRVVEHYREEYPGLGFGALVETTISAWNPQDERESFRGVGMIQCVKNHQELSFWHFFSGTWRGAHLFDINPIKASLPSWFSPSGRGAETMALISPSVPGVHPTDCPVPDDWVPMKIVGPTTSESFDFMFEDFLQHRVTDEDFSRVSYRGDVDKSEWRSKLKSVMNGIRNSFVNHSQKWVDYNYILLECGRPPGL